MRARPRPMRHWFRAAFCPPIGWLLALIAIGWIAVSIWYVNRVMGLQSIPSLLPHELGGILAGMLAPPAVRDQQMSYDVAVLEQQIWRMENPHRRAQESLTEVGHGLLSYAAALEGAVDNARTQLSELRGGLDAEIAELGQVAEAVRVRTIDSGETLRA